MDNEQTSDFQYHLGLISIAIVAVSCLLLGGCETSKERPPDPQAELVAKGRDLFFNETFQGNGRTCGSCHREDNNFTIDPLFIATLPADDPLFVAEFNPELSQNFENPRLMREFGLIVENLDGFSDLANKFTLRGVPHTLALRTSIASPQGPRTGWSGDGAPGDGSLRSFATGAVIQHFTKTLNRVAGVDFRLPTDDELDALEAFQLSLGRQAELALPLPLKGTVASRGQELFLDDSVGKCNICHRNAGANAFVGGQELGNANFNTGIEDLEDQPARLTGEKVPRDDGFGTPGDGTFNTPPLVEAADSPPFFHNNSIQTIESAVEFYDSETFNNSPAGQFLASIDPNGVGIELGPTEVQAIAGFLRVINALENIRQSIKLLETGLSKGSLHHSEAAEFYKLARADIEDAIEVLRGAELHPEAVVSLVEARKLANKAARHFFSASSRARNAIKALESARSELIASS
jgi:hypothetical protein